MSSPSRVFGLVEDRRQEGFLLRFLVLRGFRRDEVVIDVSPSGRGSAEQWVRKSFARQAAKCRGRNARAATGMIVMVDADTHSVQQLLNALDEALIRDNQPPIDETRDRIARLIPKRNVETWILFLSSRGNHRPKIDEEHDYKQTRDADEWSNMIPIASETLVEWTHQPANIPENTIDSLRHAIREIPRAIMPNH